MSNKFVDKSGPKEEPGQTNIYGITCGFPFHWWDH